MRRDGYATRRPPRLMKREIRRLLRRALGRKYDQWAIGIYTGRSPVHVAASEHIENPVLTRKDVTDVQGEFVADPFMVRVDHTWHMFFEVLNRETAKGEIGLAMSSDALHWAYLRIVLSEPFSVSYPYVFQWMGSYYMIPESRRAGAVRLYEASKFPIRWSLVAELLRGDFVDSSVFRYENRWWLLAETNPKIKHDTLRLFYADHLTGPWREHPRSPIVQRNPRMARPAGRVLVLEDRLIRYAQDCYPTYSTRVRAFEVTELTTSAYREREVESSPILEPSGAGWNASGMHHIDPHPIDGGWWLACVDGRSAS
ncbi:MAG: glucosamine inositolphosphorylceramide transferase family protein [bacterium]